MTEPTTGQYVERLDSAVPSASKDFQFEDAVFPTRALTYAPASVVRVGNARFVQLSGHTSVEQDESELGPADDVAQVVGRQTDGILQSLASVLAGLGGELSDVTRVRVYVRSELTHEVFAAIHAARRRYFTGSRMPASTLVRVTALVRPTALVEVDADAVIIGSEGE